MRILKFRGKTNSGNWIYGNLVYSENIQPAIYFEVDKGAVKNFDWVYVDPETVGQFTGDYDKKAREAFEGDIVRWTDSDGAVRIDVIIFGQSKFYLCNCLHACSGYDYEIVGNVHDKGELLQEAKPDV